MLYNFDVRLKANIKRRGRVIVSAVTAIQLDLRVKMDLYKAIQDLYAEKEKLERVIASLEELQRSAGSLPLPPSGGKRRGRKSMSSKERQEVSERMKKYWASRRKKQHDSNRRQPERES